MESDERPYCGLCSASIEPEEIVLTIDHAHYCEDCADDAMAHYQLVGSRP